MARVLLLEDIGRTQVGPVEMRPAAKRDHIDVDVDTEALLVVLAVFQTLSYSSRSDVLGRTDGRVAVVPLPLRLVTDCQQTPAMYIGLHHTIDSPIHLNETMGIKKPNKFFMANHLGTTGFHQIRCHTILLAARHKRAHPAL